MQNIEEKINSGTNYVTNLNSSLSNGVITH
jgi:hypothetical protein